MDDRSIAALEQIRTKTVPELLKHEIAFLRARRSYLTLDDKDRFESVLVQKKSKKSK